MRLAKLWLSDGTQKTITNVWKVSYSYIDGILFIITKRRGVLGDVYKHFSYFMSEIVAIDLL